MLRENILIADNQPLTCAGLGEVLSRMGGQKAVTQCQGKAELVAALLKGPDSLVLLDYALFDFGDVSELLVTAERFQRAAFVLISEQFSPELVRRVWAGGYKAGFVLKDSSLAEIEKAIDSSSRGLRYFCEEAQGILAQGVSVSQNEDPAVLTRTETEIIRLLSQGKSTKEIAAIRSLSYHTVTTHRKNIFRKMGVNNLQEAVKYAFRAGWIDLSDYYI